MTSPSQAFNQNIGAAKALWEFQDAMNRLGYNLDHPSADVKRINDLIGNAALRYAGYVDAVATERGIARNGGLV
jgi:hypothetical protein